MSTAFHLVFAFYLHVIIIFLILWHRIGSINVSIRCQCIGFVSHERSSKSPQVIGFSARPYPHIGKTIILSQPFLTSQSANVETTYPHPFTPKILSIFLEAWPVASALNFNLKPRAQPFLPYPPAQSFLFAKSSNQKWLPPLQDHQDTPGYRFSA